MIKKIRFLFLFLVAIFGISYGYCEVITFDDYKKYLKEKISETDINIDRLEKKYEIIKNTKCNRTEDGNNIIVKPICLWNSELPVLGLKKSVDLIIDDISSFAEIYNTTDENFSYEGTYPIYKTIDELAYYNTFQGTFKQKVIITQLESKKYLISIDKKILARNELKEYTFYVAQKSLVGIGNCSLKNYKNSMNQVDKLMLKPGEVFNLNNSIANIDGYCKGTKNQDLMFFGGVCGTAGQLFRVGLITPDVTITKRSNHAKWRVRYYGEYAYGDDAAIYEMDKQFEIKNDSDQSIYFRFVDKGDYTYLMSVVPSKTNKSVNISKKETGELTSQVIKQTVDGNTNEVIDTQFFNSTYDQKFYGGV